MLNYTVNYAGNYEAAYAAYAANGNPSLETGFKNINTKNQGLKKIKTVQEGTFLPKSFNNLR